MIEPLLADDALLADVAKARRTTGDQVSLWWLGQSGFLIQCAGKHLLLDPYLSDSLTKKYSATEKPHIRMTRIPIAPERLDFVDVALSTHNHTDHLDADTLNPIRNASGCKLIVGRANIAFAADRLGCGETDLLGIDAGESTFIDPFEIRAVPAAHEELDKDDAGAYRFLGYVIRCGGVTIYHSGDSVPFFGQAELLRPMQVDIAILPINGRKPERKVSGNMNGAEAATLAQEIGAKVVIPCHYEMFTFNTETPDQFMQACKERDQQFKVLRCGERFSVDWV